MRLFLAIDLPLKVKEKIENRLKDIKQKYPEFKWVGELNYHITIHFFGDNIFHKNMGDKIKQALFDTFSFYLYSSECKLFIRRKIKHHFTTYLKDHLFFHPSLMLIL